MQTFAGKIRDSVRRASFFVRILAKVNKWSLISIAFISICIGIIPAVGSYVNAHIIDFIVIRVSLQSVELTSEIIVLVGLRCLLFLLSTVLSSIYDAKVTISGVRVTDYLRRLMCDRAHSVEVKEYDSPDFYGALENALQEVGNRPVGIFLSLCNLLSGFFSIGTYILIVLRYSGLLALVLCVLSIPRIFIAKMFKDKIYEYNMSSTTIRRKIGVYSKYPLNPRYVKELKAFRLFDWFSERYKESFGEYFAGLRKIVIDERNWKILLGILGDLLHVAVYVNLFFMAIRGAISVGEFTLFFNAFVSMASLLQRLTDNSMAVYSGTLFIDNLASFLKGSEKEVFEGEKLDNLDSIREIKFSHVSFSYPKAMRKALDDVSFVLKKGQVVSFIGLNGSGKSTIMKLLLGFYEPTEGEIFINGTDIRCIDKERLTKHFSVLFQDFERYPEKIGQMIRFGAIETEWDSERATAALDKAAASSLLEAMPCGYDTSLTRFFDEKGHELSLGQWQKVCIARAFYSQAEVLILDEPSSALDPVSECTVYDELMRHEPERIKVVISHKIPLIHKSDQIIVLKNGSIVEQGTHAELMQKEGTYASYVAMTRNAS